MLVVFPHKLCGGVLAFAVLIAGCAGVSSHKQHKRENLQETEARIVGEVVVKISTTAHFPKIAGKTLPKKDYPIYLFTWEESVAIRDLLEQLKKDSEAVEKNPEDMEKFWIAMKRTEEIYDMVIASGPSRHTKTDENGCFVFRNLQAEEKYLLIGADVEYETGIILLPQIVGPLVPGENRVRLVDEW